MRDFVTIQQELKLKKFLDSPLGTLYFVPTAPGASNLLVRHFDGSLSPSLIPSFVAILRDAQRWIERSQELRKLVRIEQPVEIGSDFVAREHHIYGIHLAAYTDWEDPPEPPAELRRMQTAFRNAVGRSAKSSDSLLTKILSRSLLSPTSKTYFDEEVEQFIVLELKPTRDEVERWSKLMTPASL